MSPYFKALNSPRREEKVSQVDLLLRQLADQRLPNPFKIFPELDGFDLYAGDGHYVENATHDPKTGETHWPTGHFFAMDLKTKTLRSLCVADSKGRKKEHDMRALKRFDRELEKQEESRPWLYSFLRRFSQTSYKLVRWLRSHWKINSSLTNILNQLTLLYSKL